jgi:hypothetical protein
MGIFGYSFLFENLDTLKGVNINGVEPSFDTIATSPTRCAPAVTSTSRTRIAA